MNMNDKLNFLPFNILLKLFQDNPNKSAHAKFTNYWFDKSEFLKLVKVAANYVKENKYSLSPEVHDEL